MKSRQTKSAHFSAMQSHLVTIEANFMRGFTGLTLVGSTSEICKGGLLRAQAALENLDYKIPQKKILVSLFPADQKKEGNQFDLAFAVCLYCLIEDEKKIRSDLNQWVFASELGLDGSLNRIKGAVSFTLSALESKQKGIILNPENAEEIEELRELKKLGDGDFQILGFKNLQEVLLWTTNELGAESKEIKNSQKAPSSCQQNTPCLPNYDDMLLSPELFDIASAVATGSHNLFISGAPGTGKSMFSQRLVSILPKLEGENKIEILRIHSSFTSKIQETILRGHPPYRAPHHSTTTGAVIGSEYSPGEIALAHKGILFMDEFPEFRKDIIESLREPIETGNVTVSRARTKISWKSDFILIIAANNCPCGWLGSRLRRCICPSNKIINYKRKLSGPILDRIDIHINLYETMVDGLSILSSLGVKKPSHAKTTEELCARVKRARNFSLKRNKEWSITCNKELKGEHLMEAFGLEEKEFNLWLSQFNLGKLSNRSMFKVLKVARTLADLDCSRKVREKDLLKALSWSSTNCAKSRGDLAYGFA